MKTFPSLSLCCMRTGLLLIAHPQQPDLRGYGSDNASVNSSGGDSDINSQSGSQAGSQQEPGQRSLFVNGESGRSINYWEPLPIDKHQHLYGYNFDNIPYPFKKDSAFQIKWLERLKGNYNFPDKMVPEYDQSIKCKHGRQFSNSDNNLYRESKTFILYSELTEQVFDIPVFARRSVGACRCLQRVDGTKFLIWNLGNGRFVDFTLLHSYVQKWSNSGLKIFALWKSIVNSALSAGLSCTLEYDDLHRSVCGFVNNAHMDFRKVFSCPDHGTSPEWIVSDGKNMGPLKKRVSHLKELLPKEDDQKILSQSTKFKDRLFIPAKSERDNVCQLLTGNVTMQDFSETAEIRSENGQMIIEVVRHIMENFPEEMPRSYRKFLQNVCSPASVRGLLQVNFSENLCVVFFILLIIFV